MAKPPDTKGFPMPPPRPKDKNRPLSQVEKYKRDENAKVDLPDIFKGTPEDFKEPPPRPLEDFGMDDIMLIMDENLRREHRSNPLVVAYISSYVMCRDQRQAAEEAGITRREAGMLHRRRDVATCIDKITQASVLKFNLDPEEIVEKVKAVAFVDPADVVDKETGAAYENLHDIPPETRRAIKKFEVKNIFEKDPNGMDVHVGNLVKVEMWDRLKASEMLGREKNLFKETKRMEHDVTSNMKDLLLEAKNRAEERAKSQLEYKEKPLEIEAREVDSDDEAKDIDDSE